MGRAAERFVISVIGYPVKFLGGEDQATLSRTKDWILASAALIQKGKGKISPMDVRVTEIGENVVVRFFFPREKTIQAKDKVVRHPPQSGWLDE